MDTLRPQSGSDTAALIDSLVNTYRELNTRFRSVEEQSMASSGARDVIMRMRNDELRFAQALKERVSGVGFAVDDDDDRLVALQTENDDTRMMISQFGNARATTLSLLKDVNDTAWTNPLDDGKSILEHVQLLASSDAKQLQRLGDMLGN